MVRIAERPCPICGHAIVEVLHSQRFALPHGHPLSDGYDVVCCEACGFVYADTASSQEAFNLFYERYSKYEDHCTSTGGGGSPWDLKRLEQTAEQIVEHLRDPQARILDVGCANGGLLEALRTRGYDHLVGIDPSPTCVENTRRLGIRAEQGSLFGPIPQDGFDLVALSHVLEHVHDLKRALDWVSKVPMIAHFGRVYIEVPDASRYGEFLYSPFQEFNTEHINHFSTACLNNCLGVDGFEIIEQGLKLIETGPSIQYPAIDCFAKVGAPMPGRTLKRDNGLKMSIRSYVEESKRMLGRIDTRLRTALANCPQVIVWGTGQLAMKLLVDTCLSQARIAAFVDSNPINQGVLLRGIPILAPEALMDFPDPIVVGTTLHQESVAEQARSLGLPNKLILLGA